MVAADFLRAFAALDSGPAASEGMMQPRIRIVLAVWLGCACAAVRAQSVAGAVPFSQGLDALERADWSAAIAGFDLALQADDDNWAFHLGCGVARVLVEQFPEGQKDLQRALKLKADDFDAKLWRAACYFMANNP